MISFVIQDPRIQPNLALSVTVTPRRTGARLSIYLTLPNVQSLVFVSVFYLAPACLPHSPPFTDSLIDDLTCTRPRSATLALRPALALRWPCIFQPQMAAAQAAQRLFITSPQFAVVGASKDESKFGTKVLRWYLERNKLVTPIHPVSEGARQALCHGWWGDLTFNVECRSRTLHLADHAMHAERK